MGEMYRRQFFSASRGTQSGWRTKGAAKESKNILRRLFLRPFRVALFVLLFVCVQRHFPEWEAKVREGPSSNPQHSPGWGSLVRNSPEQRNLSELLFRIKKTIMKKKKMNPKNELIDEQNKMKKKKKKKKIKKINDQTKRLINSFYAKNGQVNNESTIIVKNQVGEIKPKVEKQTVVINDIDTWEDLEEGELFGKIKSLNGLISSSQMYSIWKSVHTLMRKKYFYREENLWTFCEKIAKSCHVPKETKVNIWYKVYYNMKEETIKTEKDEFNKIYPFVDDGPCEHDVFIKFLFDELDNWKKKMKNIEIKWRHLLFLNLKFSRRRNMILLNSL
ncbi:Plasmodium exported protein (PHIST), unknown function [Plasmodium vivax]|uniref:Plasmodium RESA N-terminal domain-containing protein n=1 Tax=Plasmodium vivax TaxID=5855 RepID=A0A564ZRC1_PLAVI|nr:Plasmodium exported protein (PHIST), unknown function [Plasmodium vivax]